MRVAGLAGPQAKHDLAAHAGLARPQRSEGRQAPAKASGPSSGLPKVWYRCCFCDTEIEANIRSLWVFPVILIGIRAVAIGTDRRKAWRLLIVRDLGRQIRHLKEQGLTILLCEQNAKFAIKLSDRAYILEKGHVRFSGSIEALHANDDVRRQHLGL